LYYLNLDGKVDLDRMPKKIRLKFVLFNLLVFVAISHYFYPVKADPDLWGHTKFGIDLIQNGHLPKVDSFSFTAEGNDWINHEWLSEAVFGICYILKQDQGLFWLRTTIFAVFVLGMLLLYWARWPHPVFIFILSIFALPYFSVFLNVRPHSFTYLLIVVSLLCLEAYRLGKKGWIWILPPVMILWVNLHGGFVVGVGLIATGLLSLIFQKEDSRNEINSYEKKKLLLILFLTLFSTICNPYGTKLFLYLFMALSLKREFITEWRTVSDAQVLHHIAWFLLPGVLLIISKGSKRVTQTIFFLITAFASFWNVRFFILLVIFGSLVFLDSAKIIWDRHVTNDRDSLLKNLNAPLILFVLLLIMSILLLPKTNRNLNLFGPHVQVNPSVYPTEAIQILKGRFMGPNIAIPFKWGEYAIWHLSPAYKVSVDGRYETAYSPEYVESHIKAYYEGNLEKFLSDFQIDLMLVENMGATDRVISSNKRWIDVYRDDTAAIYVPRGKFTDSHVNRVDWQSKDSDSGKVKSIFP
jgi:hypothetical protein